MSIVDACCCKCNRMWPRGQLSAAVQVCWDKTAACNTRIIPDDSGRPRPPDLTTSTDVDMFVVETKPPEASAAELQQVLSDLETLLKITEKYDGAAAANSLTDKLARKTELQRLIEVSRTAEIATSLSVAKLSQLVRAEVSKG